MTDNVIKQFTGRYKFLSNFAPSNVEYGGHRYGTIEIAFQAAKCTDENERRIFDTLTSSLVAKKTGLKVKLRPDWEEVKMDIMLDLTRQKFQDPAMRQQLLDTGSASIVEGNHWHDNFWGVCYCGGNSCRGGENKLGRVIMKVRDELQG